MNINLKTNGAFKICPVGFSWTLFFFSSFVPLFRGDIAWFFITLFVDLCTVGFGHIFFCFSYNQTYIKSLLSKGYVPVDDFSRQYLVSLNLYNDNQSYDDYGANTSVATPYATPATTQDYVTPVAGAQPEFILLGEKGCFQGMTMPIHRFPSKIGRDTTQCKVQFPEGTEGVSRIHCTIYNSNNGFTVVDSSTYGTFVNGQKIATNTPVKINNGDYIALGSSQQILRIATR